MRSSKFHTLSPFDFFLPALSKMTHPKNHDPPFVLSQLEFFLVSTRTLFQCKLGQSLSRSLTVFLFHFGNNRFNIFGSVSPVDVTKCNLAVDKKIL